MQRIQPTVTPTPNGASGNGANGHHSPPALTYSPSGSSPAENEGKLDYHAVISAFRRKWFLAIGLGLLFGIPAAIACWTVTPAPFISFAELQLLSFNSQAAPGSSGNPVPNFAVWKQQVLNRATHPQLIYRALDRSEAAKNASMLRAHEPHVVPWLEQNLSVKSVGTEYIRIELEGEDATEVTAIVQAIAEQLKSEFNESLKEQKRRRRLSLEKVATDVVNEITIDTKELQKEREDIKVDPSLIAREQLYLVHEENRLREELLQLQRREDQFRIEFELRGTQSEGNQKPIDDYKDTVLESKVTQDPEFLEVDRQVFDLEQSIEEHEKYSATLVERLTENHPLIRDAENKLQKLQTEHEAAVARREEVKAKLKKELLESLPEGVAADIDPQKRIERYREYFQSEFDKNEEAIQELQVKNREQQKALDLYRIKVEQINERRDAKQDRLEKLETEIDELVFEIANMPDLVAISRDAVAPHVRSLKKKTMFSGVAGLGVFGFFVAGIVFLEYRTQRIASLNQVSENLNLRVMGAVPLIPSSATKNGSAKKQAKNAIWYSALTEAVDSTRTLLIRGSQIESLKTIMVTSAMGGEGKTTMSSHLATSLARGGRKILLIDCDLRRPCVHRAFDLPMENGLCEILRGEAKLEDCLLHLESPAGLSILPAGKLNQQVLKLLAMDSLNELLESLKSDYDFIIIDSSPLLPVTDGLLVAQHVDGVILSIRRDVSRIGKVVNACQKLSMLGIPLLGAVTIGLEDQSAYRQKYGYNYHYYGQGPTS